MVKGDSTEVYNINLIPEHEESETIDSPSKEAKSYTTHDVSIGDEFKEHEIKSLQNFSKSTSSRSDSSSDLPDDVKGICLHVSYLNSIIFNFI